MIVRVETGVINRAPYVIAFLHDPAAGPEPEPGRPSSAPWNGTLVYGAGDDFRMGSPQAGRVGIFDLGSAGDEAAGCVDALIGLGYAVAAAETIVGPSPYDIVAAETLLRVREWFIKRYGLPAHTAGIASGEAAAALMRIASTYPGLDSVLGPEVGSLIGGACQ